MKRQYRLWTSCLLLGLLGWVVAQPDGGVAERLTRARALVQEAKQAYAGTIFHPDQPLWQQAIRIAEEALELEPESPEALRFLAETYNTLHWDIRAWNYWQRYLAAGGALDEGAAAGLAEAGIELGFARYQAGDLQGALDYYRQVHDLLPDNQEALTWLGRIHFELGRPQEALPYWQRLVELNPDDEGARYYLERVRQQLQVGVAAERAFQRGLAAYNAGRREEALARFEEAVRLGQGFKEAVAWAGRVSLELGRSADAVRYWQRVLTLDPSDERAGYFLERAQAQLTWGVPATQAYQEGLSLYDAGELEAAAAAFEAAVSANPSYKDALVWAARAFQELGRAEEAIRYWQQVLALDPQDERAQYFLQLAQDQRVYGAEAASAFNQGLSSYQDVEFDEAEAFFRQAVEANPDYAEAWAWLGRIHFDQAEYAEAAGFYERALALEPGNDAYAFFAGEARRLAPDAPSESER